MKFLKIAREAKKVNKKFENKNSSELHASAPKEAVLFRFAHKLCAGNRSLNSQGAACLMNLVQGDVSHLRLARLDM